MKIFDLHADIGYDVMQKRKEGYRGDILERFHVDKFRQGDIAYIGMASYFEGHETWDYMQEMVRSLKEEIQSCDQVDLVLTKEDLLHDNGHIKAILTIEGMCGIKDEPEEKITWLYEQGVRIASLCWNDENALATGAQGSDDRGLTDLGIRAIKKMMEYSMIIDISHANEQTFWDIMEESAACVMATHSNVRNLCDHPRNLWIPQLHAIKEHQGIVGAVSAPGFVSREKDKQDLDHLVNHIRFLCDELGVDHVGLGFDFMDYYEEHDYGYTEGLKDCTTAQLLIDKMKERGFKDSEIEQIAYGNALRLVADIL